MLYGLGKASVSVMVNAKKMTALLKSPAGHNRILNLKVGEEQSPAMAVDWQVDPVKGTLLHVDMQRIDLKKKVHARVPAVQVGSAVGVREQAGLVEQISREIEIECLPLEVPTAIEVDIAALHIGDVIRVRDLPRSEVYSYLSRPDQVIVHVIAPKVEKEPTTAEEAIDAGAVETEGAEQPRKEASSES